MTPKWGYRAALNDTARLSQTASTLRKTPATLPDMQAGMQTGEALALQKLLAKRFGTIPTETISQITNASTAQIDAWLDVMLDAPSLDVIFGSARH